jgi:hypothetical protein
MSKFAIILTTTCETHNIPYIYQQDSVSRKQQYLKTLGKWLCFSSLPIILIDNSKKNILKDLELLNNDRFEYLWKPNKKEGKRVEKGYLESIQILQALTHSKLINKLSDFDYIFKITGRYFIDNFETILSKIPRNKSLIHQNKGKYCEIVGFQKMLGYDIFLVNDYTLKLERVLYSKRSEYNCYRLPKMSIEATQMGGRNEVRTSL